MQLALTTAIIATMQGKDIATDAARDTYWQIGVASLAVQTVRNVILQGRIVARSAMLDIWSSTTSGATMGHLYKQVCAQSALLDAVLAMILVGRAATRAFFGTKSKRMGPVPSGRI